jgi:hypothetical protein
LILQGTADLIITPPSQLAFVQALCELDNAVTYLTYRAAAHADTRFRSFRDTVAWMRSLAAAETVESSCAELAAS